MNLIVNNPRNYYVGQPVFFPKRTWLGRCWQRLKILLRIGGRMEVVAVNHSTGAITVRVVT